MEGKTKQCQKPGDRDRVDMPVIMAARKLAGLSSEQMSIFSLKKSIECAAGFWNEMLLDGGSSDSSSVLREKCVLATATFCSVIQSTEQLKDSTSALQTFLSEDVMIAYLRLALLTCGNQILSGIVDDSKIDQLSVDILLVVTACLKCMDSGDNIDKLTNDFTEGAIYIINISIVALKLLSTSKPTNGIFLVNYIRLASIYIKALATMSRKFSNRKKLYVTFCSRLFGPCIKLFQSLENTILPHAISSSYTSSLYDLTHILETLIENSLFFEEKNIEDLAISGSSIENFKVRTAISDVSAVTKDSATFKGSYHGVLFDALTATCSEVLDKKNMKSSEGLDCSGYPFGVARLLHIYGRCSYKILSSSLVVDHNHDSRNAEVVKSPSSLQERRKHTIRLLQTALSLLSVVDTAFTRRLVAFLSDDQQEGKNEDTGLVLLGHIRCLVACIRTQREILLSLSMSMDETGGSSILATHDNLQSIAKRLHFLSNRSLKGASLPLSVFLSPDLIEKYSTLLSNTSDIYQRTISNLCLEARSVELDCVRTLVGIDHRVIIESTSKKSVAKQADARLPSLVLQAIAYSSDTRNSLSGDVTQHQSSSQLLNSKEQLLISVMNLYDDLRRMDDFVSEVRGVCRGEPSALSSLFTLLSSQRVQERLSKAFASLPVSQSELVWSALTRHTAAAAVTDEEPSSTSSLTMTKRSDKRCESMILRALVQASALSSMAASTRRQVDTSSPDDVLQSCDDILQLGAVISLSTALPDTIVQSMSTLFLDTLASLEDLEKETETGTYVTNGRSREPSAFVFNVTSMLLQYGSVAISLHKSTSTVKSSSESSLEDVWLPFRQCAGAISTLKILQRPGWQRYCDAEECVAATAALLSLSAFVATCSSLQLSVPVKLLATLTANSSSNGKMDVEGEKDEGDATTQPSLTCKEVDAFVLEMITTSSSAIDHHASANSQAVSGAPLGSETGSKRKRKDIEVADTRPRPLPSPLAAIDLLLIITRTVSVWQHLNPAPEVICALTISHLNDVTRHYSDPNNSKGRGLFQKHACLCRLIQLVAVLECPVLVTGFLMAVEHVIVECSASLSSQSLTSNSKTRSKTAKTAQPLSIAAMSLLSQGLHNTLLSHGTGLPVGDLLAASAASVVVSKHHHNSSISADIALRAITVISKLLGDLNRSVSNDILSWEDAAHSMGTDSTADDKQSAFAAAVNVLQHCLRCRPASTKPSDTASDAIATKPNKPDSWHIVELQLHCSFVPLLTALTTENSPAASAGVRNLIPLILDYLLSSSTLLTSDGGDTGNKFGILTVLSAVIKSITTVLKAAHQSPSTLRSFVEIFRHVSSFYCSLPVETPLITETGAAVKAALMTLLSSLQPHLQHDASAANGLDNYFDPCCFLATDCIRLHAKCSEAEEEDQAENASASILVNVPYLHGFQSSGQLALEFDGWFLLTGTILMLQRRSGKLLSVRTATLLIERISQALLLSAASHSRCPSSTHVREESLVCVSVCLKGLITSVPHILAGEVGKMFMQLAQHCAVSTDGVADMTASRSSTALSQYVVIGVDNLLGSGGQNSSDADSDGNGTLASARAVLESVALSCTSNSQMLTQPELVLALISALRRGITTIQQQQQRSHKRASKSGKKPQELLEVIQAPIQQDEDSFKGKDHTLTRWASCCLSVLSKIAPRLVRGGGGIKGSNVTVFSDEERVDISAHALSVLEQLFACDSVGGSNLPLLGYSIGTLGALLSCTIRVILASSEHFGNETRKMSTSEALSITNALRVAGRTLTAAATSRELTRHAHILAASLTDLIAQRPLSTNAKELLLPGLFALFDRCKQKQRLQMFATVNVQTRAVLSDLHGTYLRDFKFTGK